ncbi:hypothetical protein ACPOLB_00335 [Rubrivivax sp. RP6-9]|uniref:hypothetical protein n=1 Tax=Rubrivivax sp. RP6-9 TaxID=3415750 RepID=UPI003CC524B3
MKTPTKTPLSHVATSIAASVLVTFHMLSLIANYALPDRAPEPATHVLAAAAPSAR